VGITLRSSDQLFGFGSNRKDYALQRCTASEPVDALALATLFTRRSLHSSFRYTGAEPDRRG